jgi:hypothetical protein
MKISNIRLDVILTGLILLPAAGKHPYLDPGSGSFILQMLIAGAAGAVFILRNQIGRFFDLFRRDKKSEKKAESKKANQRNAK